MNNEEYISTFDEFVEQTKNPEKAFIKKEIKDDFPGNNIIRVRKNLILSYLADCTGCGHLRNIFWMTYLNAVFGKTGKLHTACLPFFCFQEDVLIQTRALFFQRQMAPNHVKAIEKYKKEQSKFKYQMVYDLDDNIFGYNELQGGSKFEGVPSYNFGSTKITDEIRKNCIDAMNFMDKVSVTSEYLKQILINNGVKVPIYIIPNSVSMYFFGTKSKRKIESKIEKPRIIYTGSPTHYSNEHKLLGDWENSWLEYIISSVKNNEIEFMVMGGLPWFFEEIKDKIKIVPWLNSFQYHLPIIDFEPHFSIGPLVSNDFNSSKSDIKMIESFASFSIFIGTIFSNKKPSPYDKSFVTLPDNCSVLDIKDCIKKYCEPENFNDIIQKQNKFMKEEGRYLESPQFVNLLTSFF